MANETLAKERKLAIMDDYFNQRDGISCPRCGAVVTVRDDGGSMGDPPNLRYTIICKKCVYFESYETAETSDT